MKLILLVVTFLFSTLASAGSWQTDTSVSTLLIEGSEDGSRVYVIFGDNFNPDACSDGDLGYKRVYGNTEKGKYIVSNLMAAQVTDRKVSPHINGCDDWGRAVVTGLIVRS